MTLTDMQMRLLRQHERELRASLDLSDMLRRTLEMTLMLVGPTNIVAFVPEWWASSDWQVGAYVLPKWPGVSDEVLLDMAADHWPQELSEVDLKRGSSESCLGGTWQPTGEMISWTLRHDETKMAVIVLWRDEPFPPGCMPMLGACRQIQEQHLFRCFSIHNRLLPIERWSDGGEEQEQEV